MGAASCKNPKLLPQTQLKEINKNITIGIFGLNYAGKTSTVKAIEGAPTRDVSPTRSTNSIMITYPFNEKGDRIDKNTTNQQHVKIIDVSGERKFRQQSWSEYYDQIHGLIFVMDASDKKRFRENQETLDELLNETKLKDKPILILANKQDQQSAIKTEPELKRQLDIERLKSKHKIELCTAVPKDKTNKVDESIRKGFLWLIRTIDENYMQLNSRVNKGKDRKFHRSDSDENDSDNKYAKKQNTDHRSKMTYDKLPGINMNKNKTKSYSDDDDQDDRKHSINGFSKKKKVLGPINSNNAPIKKSNDNETKAFRTTYESFPEEAPWSSSPLRTTKSDDMLPRLNTKSLLTNETRRRDVSPLVHDAKPYGNKSISKRDDGSEDEEDYTRQQKSKSTNRFDNSSLSANKSPSNIRKPLSSIYDDDYDNTNNRRAITTQKKPYDDDDDYENDYSKKSTISKTNKNYDSDDDKTYHRPSDRLNVNSDYRETATKPPVRSSYTNSTYPSSSKPINHSKYDNDDDDDDDDHPRSSSKPKGGSKYDDDDDYPSSSSKPTTRSKYDNDDRSFSSSKPTTHSKYDDDDDYPSKPANRAKYDNKDDDYYSGGSTALSKKNTNSSSYNDHSGNGGGSRSRFGGDDFFTSKGGSNDNNRFRKDTDYDY